MAQSLNAPESFLTIRNLINKYCTTMSKFNKDFENLSLVFVSITFGMVAVSIGIGAIYTGISCKRYKGNLPNKFARTRHATEAWRKFGIV
jgi:hypothetical protein